MMKYGAETPIEHKFTLSLIEMERHLSWVDVYLSLKPLHEEVFPEDLSDSGVLVNANFAGEIIQIILQNEGCDSEYQFTYTEKERIERFFNENCAPKIEAMK